MTTPSLEDVRKAAEYKLPLLGDYRGDINIAKLDDAHKVLAEFALSVLNATGMTAERLAEIQATCNVPIRSNLLGYDDREIGPDDVNELITEVLRLRAEQMAAIRDALMEDPHRFIASKFNSHIESLKRKLDHCTNLFSPPTPE